MPPYIWIVLLVFALIVVGTLLVAGLALRRASFNSDLNDQETHPKGYYVSIGISIGAGLGVALGLVFDNLALGIAIGAAIGVSIGGALEQRNQDQIRPSSESEHQTRSRKLIIGLILGLLGLVVLVGLVQVAMR